ncbi:MAG: serine/threonine protein kinase [Anaerolineales bacterium]|nr:serine/threonine protein kinase [Anaerolineales bacterium]
MTKLQPEQMLGAYRIIKQIGEGGMATVYKAYQLSMDRNVAVKVLPGQLAESEEFVKRFKQEARIIARLEHPHILPVFDYGEENGIAYFVMRYLEAGTLKEKMKAGALSLDEIDRIFEQLTEALGYAHAQGVVHRDLKPANVLVDSGGNLFLTDFGIAKILESASPRLTQTEAIMGTPDYISPEQAAALNVDQRSDIYSLGVILYELVTGRVPFVADTPLAVILKHISDPLPPPSSVKRDIPRSIEEVILKALAKDPDDRFANTDEFLSAWKQALTTMETMSAAPKKIPPAAAQTQEKPAPAKQAVSKLGVSTLSIAIGCIAVLCLLASVVGVSGLAMRFLNPSTPLSTASETPAPSADVPNPTEVLTSANIILEDDFSNADGPWGTINDLDSFVQYENDSLRMIVQTKNWFVWTSPNSNAYRNVHLEATFINNGTDKYTAFGLMCDQQGDGQAMYYFAVTPAGQYVIARVDSGVLDNFLTNNDQWGFSSLIPQNASSYRVAADCGNGVLTLYVDGQMVDSVTDSTYTSGRVGVVVWSAIEASKTDMSIDDFLLSDLP